MNKIYQKRTLCGKNPAKGKISGFTLIELLVVVLIIGILSAIALPEYTKAVEKSRSSEAMTLLRSFIQAQKMYKLANTQYTSDFTNLDLEMPNIDAENKRFSTNDWVFTMEMHELYPSSFSIFAARAKDGTAITTGDYHYGILVRVEDDGSEIWKCRQSSGNPYMPQVCKSIAGSDGVIK